MKEENKDIIEGVHQIKEIKEYNLFRLEKDGQIVGYRLFPKEDKDHIGKPMISIGTKEDVEDWEVSYTFEAIDSEEIIRKVKEFLR